ncbi:GNAT family N-acetyltransferase [Oceanobacter mangrovi]|uniref:GNAT family N-acetyltransferase n=1 Tax=Oceanobacter mangrovi TaxID=2862510 RepID=UPI001C8DFAAA|nr:GNAT family N-acetyltransferase [Oceanobacter mangrovi]
MPQFTADHPIAPATIETSYRLRQAHPADAVACYQLEQLAYNGGEEAATLVKIQRRIDQYPQGFLLLEMAGKIQGFVNSGCCYQVYMEDEGFKNLEGHDPEGPENLVMSVVIHPHLQGQGWGRTLLLNFIEHIRRLGKTRIHLMCKSEHIRFYQQAGFVYQKESASDHGGLAWHEMVLALR